MSVMPWFEGDIKIKLCLKFLFQRNYENDVKIWILKIFLQK